MVYLVLVRYGVEWGDQYLYYTASKALFEFLDKEIGTRCAYYDDFSDALKEEVRRTYEKLDWESPYPLEPIVDMNISDAMELLQDTSSTYPKTVAGHTELNKSWNW